MARLWIDPTLAEEAVFERMRVLESAGAAQARQWQHEREAIYADRGTSSRAAAFVELAGAWFERLDLARPLFATLAFTPHVRAAVTEIRLHRAARRAQEGSELFRDAKLTRLVFGLTPGRFGDSTTLPEFFLRECLYAEDMLDPGVGFSPDLDPARAEARARAELVRDRLRVLWEARISGRAAALLGMDRSSRPAPSFRRAFAGEFTPAEIDALHERASQGGMATFAQLLAAARGELASSSELGSPRSCDPAAARGARTTTGRPT